MLRTSLTDAFGASTGPTERVACYCRGEAEAAGTADVQKDSGTCLGRRLHGWVLGKQNQLSPLAAYMHNPGTKRGYVNVGGMVSLCVDWLLLRLVVLRNGADGSSKQIKEEVLKWARRGRSNRAGVGGCSRIVSDGPAYCVRCQEQFEAGGEEASAPDFDEPLPA